MALGNILKKLFGDQSERAVRPLWNRLEKEINPISEEIRNISNDDLRKRIDVIRDSIRGEAQEYEKEMADIIAMVEAMPDIQDELTVDPENAMALRADEIGENKPSRDEILKNAPKIVAGCVVVPKTVD